MTRNYNTPAQWNCLRGCKRAHVAEMHLRVSGTEVIESVMFTCGHGREAIVGTVIPQSAFDDIERRIEKIEAAERVWRMRKHAKVA